MSRVLGPIGRPAEKKAFINYDLAEGPRPSCANLKVGSQVSTCHFSRIHEIRRGINNPTRLSRVRMFRKLIFSKKFFWILKLMHE